MITFYLIAFECLDLFSGGIESYFIYATVVATTTTGYKKMSTSFPFEFRSYPPLDLPIFIK